jgi:mRNA interferase RelE/StbE
MKYHVQIRAQVKDFLEALAPEPRRRLKLAIRTLESESGDRLALRERLAGYYRLRVGGYRLIFRYLPGRVIECVFAKERSLVYHLFEREMLERLRHEDHSQPDGGDSAVEESPGKYRKMPGRKSHRRSSVKSGRANRPAG